MMPGWDKDMDTIWTLAKVVLGLEVIVLFHLFGHWLVAKFLRVPVEIRLGLGPAIPGCRFSRGRNRYILAFFPLGGYAKVPLPKKEYGDASHFPQGAFATAPLPTRDVGEVPPVWRRLFVALGGVFMNVILAWLCFSLCWSHGKERGAAVISQVDAGSPAWIKGLPTGALLHQIGNVQNPFFEDVMTQVMSTEQNESLRLVYSVPGQGKKTTVDIMPRMKQGRPMLGISPGSVPRLASKHMLGKEFAKPVFPNSPAERADPPFAFDDVIVGTTDPDNPEKIKHLLVDPRNPDSGNGDYFEWLLRLRLLAGKEITVQVRRTDGREEKIRLPPAYHFTLGVRMQMGQIVAVREGSAAEKAGIQAIDLTRTIDGDRIVAVEVKEPDGSTTSFDEKKLDPLRLPFDLRQWSRRMVLAGKGGERLVILKVLRQNLKGGQQFAEVTLRLRWDPSWENQQDFPFSPTSPVSIPELGIAYEVLTTVAAVDPIQEGNRVASLQPGDIIVAVQGDKRFDLVQNEWAWTFAALQHFRSKDITIQVLRNNRLISFSLKLKEDKTWPREDRGLILARDIRLQKADNFLEAMGLSFRDIGKYYEQILANFRGLLVGRIDTRNVGGPVVVSRTAYRIADYGFFEFIFLLALISLNFSFINLFPIPILDGGEVLLLAVEKLNGKPLASLARPIAYGVGLALLSIWMLWSVAIDLGL
jgi:regulator of sigma E protease